jgi:hypothetical protein
LVGGDEGQTVILRVTQSELSAMRARLSGKDTPAGKATKPKKVRLCPTEAQEQTTLIEWVRIHTRRYPQLAKLWHLKSEGTTWSWREFKRAHPWA